MTNSQLTAILTAIVCGLAFIGLQLFESFDEYVVADALKQVATRAPEEELAHEFRAYLSSIENRKQAIGILLGVTNISAAIFVLCSLRRGRSDRTTN